jgi:hypothetical protein
LYFFVPFSRTIYIDMSSLAQLKKEASALKIKGRGRMKKADLAVAIAMAKQSSDDGRTTTRPAVGARVDPRLPLDAYGGAMVGGAMVGGSMVGGSAKGEKPFLCDCCAANLHGAGLFDFMGRVAKGIRGDRPKRRTAPPPPRRVEKDGWEELKKLVSPSDMGKLTVASAKAGLDWQEGQAAVAKYLSGEGWRLLKLPEGVEGLHDYEWAPDVRAAEYKAFKDQLKTAGLSGGGMARKMKRRAAAQPMAPVFNSGDLESLIRRAR